MALRRFAPFGAAIDPRADESHFFVAERRVFFTVAQRWHLQVLDLIGDVTQQVALGAATGHDGGSPLWPPLSGFGDKQ